MEDKLLELANILKDHGYNATCSISDEFDGFIEIKVDGTKICDAYNYGYGVAQGTACYSLIRCDDKFSIISIANHGDHTSIYLEMGNIDRLRKMVNNIMEKIDCQPT